MNSSDFNQNNQMPNNDMMNQNNQMMNNENMNYGMPNGNMNMQMNSNMGMNPNMQMNGFQNQNMMMNNQPVYNQDEPKKKSKKPLIIVLIIVFIILAGLGGGFIYLKTTRTAEKFIDTSIKSAKNYVEKMVDNSFNKTNINLLEDDIKTKGTIKFTTSDRNLSILNNIGLDFDMEESIKNEYIGSKFTLKQDSNSISFNAYVDSINAYFESSDLYNGTLKSKLDKNVFDKLKNTFDSSDLDFSKIDKVLVKMVESMGNALKKTDMTTSVKGTKVEYKFEINDSNIDKINEEYKKVLNEDSEIVELMNKYGISFDLELSKCTITITSNALNNKVEKFEIVSEDETVTGTLTGDNTYKIENSKDKSTGELKISKEGFELTLFDENNTKTGSLKLETKGNKASLTLTSDGFEATLSFEKDGNTNNIKLIIKVEGDVIEVSFKCTNETNKIIFDGYIDVKSTELTGRLDINNEVEYGKNLISKKSFSNAKDINNLTEYDAEEIYNNFNDKLGSFKLFQALSSYINSAFGVSNSSIYDNYEYYY